MTSAISSTYALGLSFIVLVTIIWSLSSIVVQYLYTDANFDSPFLLTYIGTTLFLIFLPTRLLWERRRKWCYGCCSSTSASDAEDEGLEIIPWSHSQSSSYEQIPGALSPASSSEEVSTIENTDSNDEEGQEEDSPQHRQDERAKTALLSHREHFNIALKIAPVWFISNFTYNASLKYTSITSSTVLASTGSLFTFMFAVASKDEKFTLIKFLGVLLGVFGSALTGWADLSAGGGDDLPEGGGNATFANAGHIGTPHHFMPSGGDASHGRAAFGDMLGLLSAVGYGTYTVMIRVYCPRDENRYSMQLLLGYIGLVNGVSLLPVTIYLLIFDSTSTTIQNLTWLIFGYLVAKGMLDNVLSDYLWARAVILTSATVATVGLGLTIPLAFVSDWVMGHANVANVQSIVGAVSVLFGFVFVNVGFNSEEEEEEDVIDEPSEMTVVSGLDEIPAAKD
jgi:solute carrier family 35 protein F5